MARPDDVRFAESHEWARLKDGVLTLGISDHAVEALGDIVFVDLPEVGTEMTKGEPACEIESVKAVGEVYAPVSGTVQAVNEGLGDDPASLSADPYGAGWLIQIDVSDDAGYAEMLDGAAYAEYLESAE
jgi:glycine cleavage system H protein